MNKVLGALLLTFLFSTLFKILGWPFPPYLLIFSALGVSIVLMIKTLLMREKSTLKATRDLALSASFLIGVASTFFMDFQKPLLVVCASFFLLFLVLVLADLFISKAWKNRHALFAGALALASVAWLFKSNQLRFADTALILAFVLVSVWVVIEFFAKQKESLAEEQD